jgi:hypothetical protein
MAQMPNTPHIAGLGFRETLKPETYLITYFELLQKGSFNTYMSSNFEDSMSKMECS